MNDQEIMSNIQNLANVMEQNLALVGQRLSAFLEILDEIHPGSMEMYQKKMFRSKVMGLHLATIQAREAGRLDIVQANSNALTAMKKQAKSTGWLQEFIHAVREADHLIERPEPEEEKIIEIPGKTDGPNSE